MENNTVFVLLAGGKSKRMGEPKGLLTYKNSYWILQQLNRVSKTSIKEVVIGLGFDYQKYFEAIPWFEKAITSFKKYKGLKVKVILNKNPELGSFSTLQTVLQNIDQENTILINPIDIPILNSKELQQIIDTKNDVVFPNFEKKNGHPIKVCASIWSKMVCLGLNYDNTRLDYQLKKVNPTKISTIEVSDRVILYNLNTKSDWDLYLKEVL